MNREALHHWIQASRPPFFIATFIPLAAGWILAGRLGAWRPWRMLLVLLGSFMVHLATNLADDYFDHLQGTDDGLSIGGSRVIQEGKIAPRTILKVVILLYALAFGIALSTMAALDLWGLTPFVLLAWFFRVVMQAASTWIMFEVPLQTIGYSLAAGLLEMVLIGLLYGLSLKPFSLQ